MLRKNLKSVSIFIFSYSIMFYLCPALVEVLHSNKAPLFFSCFMFIVCKYAKEFFIACRMLVCWFVIRPCHR